ncbi:MAG: hypothetical protein IANPNBLG_02113 [Bryobacteraceae bacterium]|nr:hypothetical protein [Bryobacteraceae bacterium]
MGAGLDEYGATDSRNRFGLEVVGMHAAPVRQHHQLHGSHDARQRLPPHDRRAPPEQSRLRHGRTVLRLCLRLRLHPLRTDRGPREHALALSAHSLPVVGNGNPYGLCRARRMDRNHACRHMGARTGRHWRRRGVGEPAGLPHAVGVLRIRTLAVWNSDHPAASRSQGLDLRKQRPAERRLHRRYRHSVHHQRHADRCRRQLALALHGYWAGRHDLGGSLDLHDARWEPRYARARLRRSGFRKAAVDGLLPSLNGRLPFLASHGGRLLHQWNVVDVPRLAAPCPSGQGGTRFHRRPDPGAHPAGLLYLHRHRMPARRSGERVASQARSLRTESAADGVHCLQHHGDARHGAADACARRTADSGRPGGLCFHDCPAAHGGGKSGSLPLLLLLHSGVVEGAYRTGDRPAGVRGLGDSFKPAEAAWSLH